jgi:hypothetical protein
MPTPRRRSRGTSRLGYKPEGPVAHREDYEVIACPFKDAVALVKKHHYAKGSANTAVASHCLVRRSDGQVVGASLWMPPIRKAAVAAARDLDVDWRDVLSLSRLVVAPGEPKNATGMLLSRSMRMVPARWRGFVTFADQGQGHEGTIYKATNWLDKGLRRGAPTWVDADGRQVSLKSAGHSRTVAEMLAAGYRRMGTSKKRKFVFRRRP